MNQPFNELNTTHAQFACHVHTVHVNNMLLTNIPVDWVCSQSTL